MDWEYSYTYLLTNTYSRVPNKNTPTFINFWNFFQGLRSYYGLKSLKFQYISLHILKGYVYSFCQIFQRLRLFKGLRLFQTLEYGTVIMFLLWKNYKLFLVIPHEMTWKLVYSKSWVRVCQQDNLAKPSQANYEQ